MDRHRCSRICKRKISRLRAGGRRRRLDAIPGDAPFILHEDGFGWIYVPKGLQDGPMPTHYEPLESPVTTRFTRATRIRRCTGLRARKIGSRRRATRDFLSF